MNQLLDRPDTVVPSIEDTELAAQASRALASRPADELRVCLEDGETLVLPKAAARLLSHLLTVMGRGDAVTLFPIHAELTTQQAADLLNVSRPYLIGLLEGGQLPFHKTGSHRRVKFTDLQGYKDRQEEQRRQAMDELAGDAQVLELGY